MEIVYNLLMLAIPGAMDAPLNSPLLRKPSRLRGAGGPGRHLLNRWLIARGRGHAIAHRHH